MDAAQVEGRIRVAELGQRLQLAHGGIEVPGPVGAHAGVEIGGGDAEGRGGSEDECADAGGKQLHGQGGAETAGRADAARW